MANDTGRFDVVVIGAGSGGLTCAVGLAKAGKRVLLIEREHMGGECTNTGCIPSKAFLHFAKQHHLQGSTGYTIANSAQAGTAALAYAREVIATILAEETAEHFASLGITVVKGEAVFTGPRNLTVKHTSYSFGYAVIATGSSPRLMSIPGLTEEDILTNQNFFTQTSLPTRLLIVGSGPIGLELGQAAAMLGSQVTIITNDSELGLREDARLRPYLTEACTALGMQIHYNSQLIAVANGTAQCRPTAQNQEAPLVGIKFDKILFAIGRVPNFPAGLTAAGIKETKNGLIVDTQLKTTNKKIYAVGDVADPLKFTHVADSSARAVVAHIISRGLLRPRQHKAVPKVTYTEPEMGQVGLGWQAAVNTYGVDRLFRIDIPLAILDRAKTDDTANGHLVVVVKRLTGTVLGAHYIGPRAGEIIALFTVAIDHRLSLWKLGRTIYAYPSYAQIIKKAADVFLATQLAHLKPDILRLTKRLAPKLLILILWGTGIWYLRQWQVTSGLSLEAMSLLLFTSITTTVWGPLLYILAYTVRPLTLFPGTALTILSGTFFGLWGILYTIIGANLSASLAYGVGRYFSRSAPRTERITTDTNTLHTAPFLTILTLRLIFMPFDGVNYGAGILKVPFLPYLLATIVGTLLGISTFVSIGAALSADTIITEGVSFSAINPWFIGVSVIIFLLSLAVSRYISHTTKAPVT